MGAGNRRRQRALLETLRERIAAIPNVAEVSYGSAVPPDPSAKWKPPSARCPGARHGGGPRYIDALGMRVQGRDFTTADSNLDTAILTRRMEETLFPGQSALGRYDHVVPSPATK